MMRPFSKRSWLITEIWKKCFISSRGYLDRQGYVSNGYEMRMSLKIACLKNPVACFLKWQRWYGFQFSRQTAIWANYSELLQFRLRYKKELRAFVRVRKADDKVSGSIEKSYFRHLLCQINSLQFNFLPLSRHFIRAPRCFFRPQEPGCCCCVNRAPSKVSLGHGQLRIPLAYSHYCRKWCLLSMVFISAL